MPTDRLKTALATVVKALLTRVDYTAQYRARVVRGQGATLDVRCDDSKLGDLTGVPLRLGLPGAEFTFDSPGYVLVGFEGADPRRPFATLFDGGTFGTLTLMGPGGAKSIARVGDLALASWPSGVLLQATVTPPSGSPFPLAGTLTILDPLVGVIAAGSGLVKA